MPSLVPCRHAQLPASDPRAKRGKNFVTRQATSSIGPSLTGHWTNDFMAANPANAPSGSFHLAFKAANHSIGGSVLFLIIIYLSVYLGCPRSCLMALCDRGHPSASSRGPALSYILGAASSSPRPNCHKGKSGRGVSATRFPRQPLPQNWMKKNQKNKVMTRIVTSLAVRASRSSSPGRSG